MRRRLFTLCSALSLLLCAAVVVLWARSYRVVYSVWYTTDEALPPRRLFGAGVWPSGYIYLHYAVPSGDRPGFGGEAVPVAEAAEVFKLAKAADKGQALGFRWHRFAYADPVSNIRERWYTLEVRAWVLACLFAGPPALSVRAARAHRRRSRSGLCPACGYDLRATPDRCPECGGSVPKRAVARSTQETTVRS